MPNTDIDLLVHASRQGSAESFGHLVERHQKLVRAVAFSASGDLAVSEDLTQEAFVAAWTRMDELREPAHFGSWVCGIARNLARYARRHQTRHAPAGTESEERLAELPADAPSALDAIIDHQEASLLRQALFDIPETYREPLVLFYGESHSIAEVAGHLGLSRDTVKQRLSRGRKYLQRGVTERLQGALARPVGVGAAVLVAIAAAPRAHAAAPLAAGLGESLAGSAQLGPSAGVWSGLLTSAKLALGGVMAASLTLLALHTRPAAEPRVAPPAWVAPSPSPNPSPSQAVAVTVAPAPAPAPAIASEAAASAEPALTSQAEPARRAPRRAAPTAEPAARPIATPAAEQPLVIEHGPARVSLGAQAGPALSLVDALSATTQASEPTLLEHASAAGSLPIEPPDLAARILEIDI